MRINSFALAAAAAAINCTVLIHAEGNVTYSVYVGQSGLCNPDEAFVNILMQPQEQEVGFCQNHGVGASLFNSLEVISCTDTCFCFKQIAGDTADVNCDVSKAVGFGVKMSCFNKCLLDCNGPNCGDTAVPGQAPFTRLMLTGSGPICDSPVSEEEFVCDTDGMILEDGNLIDSLTKTAEEREAWSQGSGGGTGGGAVPPSGGTGGGAVPPSDEATPVPAESPASAIVGFPLPVALMGIVSMML